MWRKEQELSVPVTRAAVGALTVQWEGFWPKYIILTGRSMKFNHWVVSWFSGRGWESKFTYVREENMDAKQKRSQDVCGPEDQKG